MIQIFIGKTKLSRACRKKINILIISKLQLKTAYKMQANHAHSLNCLAFDLIKNAFRNLLHVAVKNKTLFEPHDY